MALTNNKAVLDWIDEQAALTKPDRIVCIDGSETQLEELRAQACATGELEKLSDEKLPGCYLHRTAVNDVARVEDRTFICCERQEDAGPTNNWMAPAEMYAKLRKLYDGAMKGRTMYVIPYSMGGIAFKIFSLLAKEKVNVDIILQSIGRNNTKDISFTVGKGDKDRARKVLEEHKDTLGFDHIDVNDQIAKVSIVGAGMINNPGVAAKMFEALYNAGININMISTSEIKVSVLLDINDADRATQVIHDRFFSEFGSGN